MRASVASNVGTAVHVVLSWCHEHLLELQIHSWKSSTNKHTNSKNNIKALLCCVHKTRVNTEPAQWDRVGFLDGLVRTDALRSAFTTLLNLLCFRLPQSLSRRKITWVPSSSSVNWPPSLLEVVFGPIPTVFPIVAAEPGSSFWWSRISFDKL